MGHNSNMIRIELGISPEQIEEVYSHASIQKLKHDHAELIYIDHPLVKYYSAFVGDEFVGCYLVAELSPIDFEAHMLLLPNSVPYYRVLTSMMADILFKQTDRITVIIIEGMKSAMNHITKIGFGHEGIKKEAFQVNGIKKDAHIFGLLKSEWEGHTWVA